MSVSLVNKETGAKAQWIEDHDKTKTLNVVEEWL